MNATELKIEKLHVHKLLGAGSGDAALLYLYIQSGNDPAGAAAALHLNQSRLDCATATLRQLDLWPQERPRLILTGERPRYTETDVIHAMDTDGDFKALYGEIQRLLGKSLNTEELKILLGFVRYLGLPAEVICVLVCYCKDRMRSRGSNRTPSLRTIEKEAYAWAEQGIDNLEEAAAFIQAQNVRNSRMSRLQNQLQIRGRNLTAAEERYARNWLEMGFEDEVITMAYERTCLNTGSLKWPYMDRILQRWHEAGLHTADAVKNGDRKPGSAAPQGQRQLDADEQAAIARILREG